MTADAPEQDFLHYLLCDLPFGYPLKTPVTKLLSRDLSMSSRRELLHQQAGFLDYSRRYLDESPWITYLAAIKHEAVFVTIPTYAEDLVDVVDKFFFADLQQKCKELREASRAEIDDPTALTCERLILLQSEAPLIEDARKSVSGALSAGFKGVEPLPLPPPEPSPPHGTIPYYIGGGIISLIIGVVVPPYYGGMAWALVGLILTGVIGARAAQKEKARVKAESDKFKTYIIHESYYALCKKSIALVLALPFEARRSALVDLSPCLTALDALPPERDALEAHYVRPFVGK
jgi:hypothetical protein